MMCCDSDILSQYLDGSFPLPRQREVEAHLKRCEACAMELANLKRMDGVLASWGGANTPLPLATERRITHSIERRKRFTAIFALGKMMPAAVGTTIAALLVLVSVNSGMLVGSAPTANINSNDAVSAKIIAKQSAPLLAARRTSAILGGHSAARPSDSTPHRTLLEVN